MAKNLGREFATMSEDERRRFELEAQDGTEAAEEIELEEPRDEDRMGRHYANPSDETADPEHRDGPAALLDDEEHERRVEEERKSR